MDYFNKFLSLLPSSLNAAGENMGKFARFIADGFTEIKLTLESIETYRNIDASKGKLLDRLGEKYGVERGQADDAFYRIMLKSKIAARSGDTTVNGILATIKNALGVDVKGINITKVSGEPNAINIENVPVDFAKTEWERNYLISRIEATAALGVRVNHVTFTDSTGGVVQVVAGTRATIFVK